MQNQIGNSNRTVILNEKLINFFKLKKQNTSIRIKSKDNQYGYNLNSFA